MCGGSAEVPTIPLGMENSTRDGKEHKHENRVWRKSEQVEKRGKDRRCSSSF